MAKILIIEDDAQTMKLYSQALSREGHEIEQHSSGDISTASIKDITPNLILLDIMLPGGKNGFDLLEELKKDEELKDIPVIIVTNLDTEKNGALEIGAVDYFVKSNTPINTIIESVKKHL